VSVGLSRAEAPVPAPVATPAPAKGAAAPVSVDVLGGLQTASDRDQIVDLIVTGTRTVAGRVAVLAVRKDALVGWSCSPEIGDPRAFRQVRVPSGTPTVLTEALEQGGAWLARFPRDPAHAPLVDLLKARQAQGAQEVAIAGVRVEGKTALAVLAADLPDASRAKKHLGEIALRAGEALARLLRERHK
jgi:hypothetical protein